MSKRRAFEPLGDVVDAPLLRLHVQAIGFRISRTLGQHAISSFETREHVDMNEPHTDDPLDVKKVAASVVIASFLFLYSRASCLHASAWRKFQTRFHLCYRCSRVKDVRTFKGC